MQIFVVLRKISKEKKSNEARYSAYHAGYSGAVVLIFILFLLKIVEVGMDWDFSHQGDIPSGKRGITGILTHPLDTQRFNHLLAQSLPLFFFIVVLVLFLQGIAGRIFMIIWIGAGLLTFIIGKPGWHIGASGLITDLPSFFFQWYPAEICSSDCHLTACHLLYGGIIWHMFPYFSPPICRGKDISAGVSWEHSRAFGFLNHGPQQTRTFLRTKRMKKKRISGRRYQQYNRLYGYYLTKSRLGLMQMPQSIK